MACPITWGGHKLHRPTKFKNESRPLLQYVSNTDNVLPQVLHYSNTVIGERELMFTFAICCRPSVCRLSVVWNVRAPYSAG